MSLIHKNLYANLGEIKNNTPDDQLLILDQNIKPYGIYKIIDSYKEVNPLIKKYMDKALNMFNLRISPLMMHETYMLGYIFMPEQVRKGFINMNSHKYTHGLTDVNESNFKSVKILRNTFEEIVIPLDTNEEDVTITNILCYENLNQILNLPDEIYKAIHAVKNIKLIDVLKADKNAYNYIKDRYEKHTQTNDFDNNVEQIAQDLQNDLLNYLEYMACKACLIFIALKSFKLHQLQFNDFTQFFDDNDDDSWQLLSKVERINRFLMIEYVYDPEKDTVVPKPLIIQNYIEEPTSKYSELKNITSHIYFNNPEKYL